MFHKIQCNRCHGNTAFDPPYASFSGGCLGHPPSFSLCAECASLMAEHLYDNNWHNTFIFHMLVNISSLPKKPAVGLVQMHRLTGFYNGESTWIPYDKTR